MVEVAKSREVVGSTPHGVTNFFSVYLILPPAQSLRDSLSLKISGGKERPECKPDNLIAICQPIV
jgi:hypothetical protein